MFRTLLIANRGEIACRVIRTARRLGIRTVAVFSEADRGALHVREAEEAHLIGPPPAAESYLRGERLLEVARKSGAEAVHPGYGFLSENASFAEACAAAGVVFVGPKPHAIRAMGSKAESKRLMVAAGVPTVPGYHGEDQSDALLAEEAARIGFPVLIKASAGGGGKGMRPVFAAEEFAEQLAGARREAQAAFGDARVLLEKYLQRPRHVEVQVFGDRHGRIVHLHTRDCSIQRRHQKVIEEAPAPFLSDALRGRLHEAAVNAARAVDYENAGTVEFVVDTDAGRNVEGEEAYFLEMNTRLQVEHPVTEEVTGLDLVEWQLRVAAGWALPESWPPAPLGHAMEARLYAEDPANDFRPAPGRLARLAWPATGRVDAGVTEGDAITAFYDPMVAKLVARGADRAEARRGLAAMLGATGIAGTTTNLRFLHRLVAHPAFAAGELDTGFIGRHAGSLLVMPAPEPSVLLATALSAAADTQAGEGPWLAAAGFRLQGKSETPLLVEIEGVAHALVLRRAGGHAEIELGDGSRHGAAVLDAAADGGWALGWHDGSRARVAVPAFRALDPYARGAGEAGADARLASPIPGRVVQVLAHPGARVAKGATLVVIEAMKTEIRIAAPADAIVEAVLCAAGDSVEEGVELVRLKPPE